MFKADEVPQVAVCAAVLLLALLGAGCGGGTRVSAGLPPPASGRDLLVVEENHSYSDVIGNPAMPYINGLASRYAVATQYYADAHPSIGNYFMLTTGMLESNNDGFAGTVTDDNIVRELVKANKTWACYAENLPSVGYLGDDFGSYVKHHNPFAYLSDVIGTPQANNVVPFARFSLDLASDSLPDFAFIVPNIADDAHSGTLAAADTWLKGNIDPLISSPAFQSNGVLIIVFDESETTDTTHGGGRVPFVIVGPQIKPGFQSTTFYQHESTLRLILSTLGVTTFPGNSSSAPNMGEFFK